MGECAPTPLRNQNPELSHLKFSCWKEGEVGQLLIKMTLLPGECLQAQQIPIQLSCALSSTFGVFLSFSWHSHPIFSLIHFARFHMFKSPGERQMRDILKTRLQILLLKAQTLPSSAMVSLDSLTMRLRSYCQAAFPFLQLLCLLPCN